MTIFMRLFCLLLPLYLYAFGPTFFAFAQESVDTRQIIQKMLTATGQVKTLKYRFKKMERVGSTMYTGEQSVKYQHTPRKTYVYLHYPSQGTEVLWIENHGKVLVKPTTFPYISINLSPQSSILRKNNHHTVYQIGFEYVRNIIENTVKQSGSHFSEYFIYQGEIVFDNRPCFKILIDYKPYQHTTYTVKTGEDVTAIARKLCVSDYKILQLNKHVDDYDDVKAGQQLVVPTAYARRTVLYIDKQNYLPLVQKMYDEQGLFSQYEFLNLQLNPSIAEEEFDRNYKEYRF